MKRATCVGHSTMPRTQTRAFVVSFNAPRLANWAAANMTCARRTCKWWGTNPIKNRTPLLPTRAHDLHSAWTPVQHRGASARNPLRRVHTNDVATHDKRTSCNWQGRLLGAATQTTGMVRTKNQSCTRRACCQLVLRGHTPGDPNTIPMHVLCSGHCTCSTHSLHHHRRFQTQTSTPPFVCACASLLARTMPLLARAHFAPKPDTCLFVPCLCCVRPVCTRLPRHYFGRSTHKPLARVLLCSLYMVEQT